jgi:hypothetical protein
MKSTSGGVWRRCSSLQRQELDHRQRREELEQLLRQEAVAADRATYLTFVAERAGGDRRWMSSGESSGGSTTDEQRREQGRKHRREQRAIVHLHRAGWPVGSRLEMKQVSHVIRDCRVNNVLLGFALKHYSFLDSE